VPERPSKPKVPAPDGERCRARGALLAGRAATIAATIWVALAAVVPRPARAYRPFDQTDAGVAELHTFELELGPVGYIQEPSGGVFVPGFIFNYGAIDRIELVFDAHKSLLFGGPDAAAVRRRLNTELLVKGVLREGSLQGGQGPSLAAEAGVFLPTLPAAGGPGASLAFIVSQRWPALAVHLNAEGDLTRDGHVAFIGGAIVEGPDAWVVRPVSEFFVAQESDSGVSPTLSALGGAIWRYRPSLAFDAAVRLAREAGERVVEIRAGLTWAFDLSRNPGRVPNLPR
jgi:hypothetical protein